MKKILFAILLVSAISHAQNFIVSQPLQLGSVPAGSASDSIMTINANGLVRQVPKSSIINIADGSETKVIAGTNTTVSGLGTTASPYVVNSVGGGSGLPSYLESNDTDLTIWNNGKRNVSSNTSYGESALMSLLAGNNNTAIGYRALKNNTSSYNTALGFMSLSANTTGNHNTSAGNGNMSSNTTGTENTSFGSQSLLSNTIGNGNTAIGFQSLVTSTSNYNTAVGNSSLYSLSSGQGNISLGVQSGKGITTGSNNVIIGSNITDAPTPLNSLSTGSNNVIIAPNEGLVNGLLTGSGNIIIGKTSGLSGTLTNTVIVSDGVGTQRIVSNAANLTTLPVQTTALITGDGTGKAILTKEYLGTRIGTVAPLSSTGTGTVGEIRVVSGYIYWCTAPNTWIRAAGSTF